MHFRVLYVCRCLTNTVNRGCSVYEINVTARWTQCLRRGRPGCYWCSPSVADSKWITFRMTASIQDEHLTGTVVVRESLPGTSRLLRPVARPGHCHVLFCVWEDCQSVLTGACAVRPAVGNVSQGCSKAPSAATQNASQKSSGIKIRKLGRRGKIYLFVSRENKVMFMSKML